MIRQSRCAHPAFVLAVLAALVCLAACDRLSERTLSEDGAESATAEQASTEDRPAPGERDADCSVDTDCKSFLRCIDSTCSVPPAVHGEPDADTPRVRFETEGGDEVAEFFVEIADTDAEQQRGLMFRREMHPDWGMLFVYDGEARRTFWMKNTFIPLDMVFIDADGEVDSIVDHAEPLTREQQRSRGPAKYVLEINAGKAAELEIEPGMKVVFEQLDIDDAPSTSKQETQ